MIDCAVAPEIRTAAAVRYVRTRKVSIVKSFMRLVLASVFVWVRKSLNLDGESNLGTEYLKC